MQAIKIVCRVVQFIIFFLIISLLYAIIRGFVDTNLLS